MEDLPPEILVLILANLPLTTLLNGLSLVSKKFYFLIKHEIQSGRLAFDLEIGPRFCHLPLLRLNSLKLTGFGDKTQIFQVLDQVNPDIQLYFENCPAVKSKKFCWVETTYVCFLPQSNQTLWVQNSRLFLGLDFVKPGLKGIHFGPEDSVPTRVYQDVASFRGLMSSLTLPRIPQIFVPLILARQQNVTGKWGSNSFLNAVSPLLN